MWHKTQLIPGIEVLECGGGGDCLFHCIATAFSKQSSREVSMVEVRQWLAQSVRLGGRDDVFLQQYRLDWPNFTGKADELQRLIQTPGPVFQGSLSCLEQLVQFHPYFVQQRLGFVLFNSHGLDFTGIVGDVDLDSYLALYNIDCRHWQLARYTHLAESGKAQFSCFLPQKVVHDMLKILPRQ